MSNRPFNGLTDAQAERLAVLVEELGEAAQAAGKVLRFGYETRCHGDPENPSGRELLEIELGDVEYAVRMLDAAGDISLGAVRAATTKKEARKEKYLHHQAGPR